MILVRFGITRPIQPITPLIDTAADVIKVEKNIIMSLTLLVSIPRVFASSSLNDNTLRFHRSRNNIVIPVKQGTVSSFTSSKPTDAKLPNNQKVIAGNLTSGSAINLIRNKELNHCW